MSYDPRCYYLAESWLIDEPDLTRDDTAKGRLAQWIQDAIDDWVVMERIDNTPERIGKP